MVKWSTYYKLMQLIALYKDEYGIKVGINLIEVDGTALYNDESGIVYWN